MTTVFSGCGIAGVLHFGRADDAEAPGRPGATSVRQMTDALAHRGPHGEGLWQQPGVVLGHRRLAVTGLGAAGDQPMTRDHLTIAYNGEAYNAPALRTELAAHFTFTTRTDTEVVLRAWQHWGPAALTRLSGMYAFAIWDAHDRCLTLVRDRIGIKPLYYHRTTRSVLFASEIEALLASGHVPRRPDSDTLTRQLLCSSTLQADPTRTPVADVRSLPPATAMTLYPDGREHRTRYWQLPGPPDECGVVSARQRVGELRELLADSVESMLMGDVPVAAFLSGGLDSSAISVLAATHQVLPCVTTAYNPGSDSLAGEDVAYSRIVAAHHPRRIRHHLTLQPYTLGLDDLDAVCDLAAVGDDPRHIAILGNYRAVRDLGLRVVLNGQGADETMGGYVARPGFIQHLLDVRHPDPTAIHTLPASRQVKGLSPLALSLRADAHAEIMDLHASLPGTPLERIHRLLVRTQLARIVQFEDFLAMRMSVEARFPFLDHHLVEWAFRQPFDAHVHAPTRRGKILLTQAMRHRLPAALLDRTKAVFPFPDQHDLQSALGSLATEHADELRQDALVGALFTVPDDLAHAPVAHLWPLLSLWRWHHRLTSSPVPATV